MEKKKWITPEISKINVEETKGGTAAYSYESATYHS
jgi:hypothetical protein